ncbi:hypothetical protein THAOC_23234, partial [Thalassiosira oceanica]
MRVLFRACPQRPNGLIPLTRTGLRPEARGGAERGARRRRRRGEARKEKRGAACGREGSSRFGPREVCKSVVKGERDAAIVRALRLVRGVSLMDMEPQGTKYNAG